MLTKKITYTDYQGRERSEDFHFNLNKPELAELALGHDGGLEEYISRIIKAKDNSSILAVFKDIIRMSVGRVSEDGNRFMKSEDITNDFMESEAYPELFMELVQNADEAANFIKGIVPPEMAKKVEEEEREHTERELMMMSDEEFDRVVGKDPKRMTRLQMQVAYQRKSAA